MRHDHLFQQELVKDRLFDLILQERLQQLRGFESSELSLRPGGRGGGDRRRRKGKENVKEDYELVEGRVGGEEM